VAERFQSILNSSAELYALSAKARTLSTLQRRFVSVAPPYLAQCSQVTGFDDGQLSIAVSNATAAAKLRQLAPELIAKLNDKRCEVSKIRVRVQIDYPHPPPEPQPRLLGSGARKALEQLGQSLGDSPLKHAVERMAHQK